MEVEEEEEKEKDEGAMWKEEIYSLFQVPHFYFSSGEEEPLQ